MFTKIGFNLKFVASKKFPKIHCPKIFFFSVILPEVFFTEFRAGVLQEFRLKCLTSGFARRSPPKRPRYFQKNILETSSIPQHFSKKFYSVFFFQNLFS